MPEWIVQRHGGASKHKWRILYHGPDEAKARALYERFAKDLRQGDIKLFAPDGRFEHTCAARVRTRW